MHRAGIMVELENPWVPSLLHHGDIALMDLALTFDFDAYQLQCINTCHLFL
jgi:hypothetical protein